MTSKQYSKGRHLQLMGPNSGAEPHCVVRKFTYEKKHVFKRREAGGLISHDGLNQIRFLDQVLLDKVADDPRTSGMG